MTGHSLGAALAVLAAMDVASNFKSAFSEIIMYNSLPNRQLSALRTSLGCGLLGYGRAFARTLRRRRLADMGKTIKRNTG